VATADSIPIHPSNAGQLQAWDGKDGDYWVTNAELFDRCIAAYDERFLDAASIQSSNRILDVGCGNGATTRAAARLAVDGFALGVDLSSRIIEAARTAAERENVRNVVFEQGDVQVHPFDEASFDAPSVAPGRCSSATPKLRSPTFGVHCARGEDSSCWSGSRWRVTSG
jgi:SAM-dependent methyltransferase